MDFRQLEDNSPSTNLLRFAKHCDGLAVGKAMPHRNDFHPNDAHWLFGYIYTVEVMDSGGDYRFTFSSTFWNTVYGFDMIGERLSELEACGLLATQRKEFDEVVTSRAPRYHTGELAWPDLSSIQHERLIVPFAGDDGRVSLLVVASQCDRPFPDLMRFKGINIPRLLPEMPDAVAA